MTELAGLGHEHRKAFGGVQMGQSIPGMAFHNRVSHVSDEEDVTSSQARRHIDRRQPIQKVASQPSQHFSHEFCIQLSLLTTGVTQARGVLSKLEESYDGFQYHIREGFQIYLQSEALETFNICHQPE